MNWMGCIPGITMDLLRGSSSRATRLGDQDAHEGPSRNPTPPCPAIYLIHTQAPTVATCILPHPPQHQMSAPHSSPTVSAPLPSRTQLVQVGLNSYELPTSPTTRSISRTDPKIGVYRSFRPRFGRQRWRRIGASPPTGRLCSTRESRAH